MSQAILREHEAAAGVRLRLVRQLDRCGSFPCILSEPLKADPFAWLAAQPPRGRFLWRDRGEMSIQAAFDAIRTIRASAGESLESLMDRCRQCLAELPAEQRLFGGFAFRFDGPDLVAPWDHFRRGEFWLPRFTLGDGTLRMLVLDGRDAEAARLALESLRVSDSPPSGDWPSCQRRHDQPDLEGWTRNVRQALQLFASEVLEKVVLARQVTLTFASEVDPWALLSSMSGVTPNCYQFAFEPEADSVFMGATPERLYKRQGGTLSSEVVAGTRRRGGSADEDRRLGEELLASEKDQLEHHIVRKSIRQRLHSFVESLEVDARAALLKLASKQHLFSRVSGRLRPNTRDEDLLGRLHPTPAVGGYPTENALAEISRLEPFERGWYAAPVGWISRDASEFVVAIRSALLRGRDLHLFSGAGIVPGSTPEAEWDEIEAKIADFLQILLPGGRCSGWPQSDDASTGGKRR